MFVRISSFVKALLPRKTDAALMHRFQQLRARPGFEESQRIDVLTSVRSTFDCRPVVGKTLSARELDRRDMLLSACGHSLTETDVAPPANTIVGSAS